MPFAGLGEFTGAIWPLAATGLASGEDALGAFLSHAGASILREIF